MPFCPKCKYEYRKGMKVCPDCDVQLEDKLHEEPQPGAAIDDSWAPLTTASNRMELDIIQGVLESAGIPTFVQSQLSTIYPTTILNFTSSVMGAGMTLCVPASRLKDAQAVVQEALRSGAELE